MFSWLLGLCLGLPIPVSVDSVDLIIRWEITSPAVYRARFQRPIWPGLTSGVTIGIGSDLGHQQVSVIRQVWRAHPQLEALLPAAGVIGEAARILSRQMQHVVTQWPLAQDVFIEVDLVRFWRIAVRVFGRDDFLALSATAQGALTSVVFNRGGSMAGPTRAEMRFIRDVCIPDGDEECIAEQIESMTRLWNVRGLILRRQDEAALIRRRL